MGEKFITFNLYHASLSCTLVNQEEFIKAMQDPSDGGAEEESTTKGGIIHTRSFSQPTP